MADLGMRYNCTSDACISPIIHLIESSPRLRYLNLSYIPLTQSAFNTILAAVSNSPSLLWFQAKPLTKGGHDTSSVKAGQEAERLNKLVRERLDANVKAEYDGISYEQFHAEHKRFLISPQDVRYIDSVYRNRDAAAARRGLKTLEKWWKDDEETLQQVMDALLV